MQLSFTTLDVFTTTRYIGNPLAVVRVPAALKATLSEAQKQKIAREFNFSEITFLHEPTKEDADTADFDIFTPLARMSFAGHPTIGTAIYTVQHAADYPSITKLKTKAGVIPFQYDASTGRATVNIPHDVYTHRALLPHPLHPNAAPSVPIVSIVKGMAFGLAQLPDLDALGGMSGPLIPSQDRYKGQFLDTGSGWDVGYTGTFYYVDMGYEDDDDESTGTEGEKVRRLRTRSLPAYEDPGTGSASAALCCFLAMREGSKGEVRFHLTQGVEMGRRCDIFVTVGMKASGEGVEEVRLSGAAVEVMEGRLGVE